MDVQQDQLTAKLRDELGHTFGGYLEGKSWDQVADVAGGIAGAHTKTQVAGVQWSMLLDLRMAMGLPPEVAHRLADSDLPWADHWSNAIDNVAIMRAANIELSAWRRAIPATTPLHTLEGFSPEVIRFTPIEDVSMRWPAWVFIALVFITIIGCAVAVGFGWGS